MLKIAKDSTRLYELDLLRFLAALAVVFFHYAFLNATEIKTIATFPFLGEVFKYGYLGVELFFIISGFVILLSATNKDWLGFIISRLSRLYPAFWIAVTLTSLVIVLFGDDSFRISISQYVWNLTMLGNFIGVENIDPVYWTLQVELKFYFWIFLILIFKKIKYIEFFIFIWLVTSILEIFHFIHGFSHPLLMPEWAPFFSAGALFYRIKIRGLNCYRLAMLILAYCLSVYFAIQEAQVKTALYELYFSPVVAAMVITAFYTVFSLIIMGKTTWFNLPWFSIVGATTYPLYLIHQKIGQIAYLAIGDSLNKYLQLFLMTVMMFALAYLLHRYLEAGFGKAMRDKLEILLNRKGANTY